MRPDIVSRRSVAWLVPPLNGERAGSRLPMAVVLSHETMESLAFRVVISASKLLSPSIDATGFSVCEGIRWMANAWYVNDTVERKTELKEAVSLKAETLSVRRALLASQILWWLSTDNAAIRGIRDALNVMARLA